jgi:hypothetical protein
VAPPSADVRPLRDELAVAAARYPFGLYKRYTLADLGAFD